MSICLGDCAWFLLYLVGKHFLLFDLWNASETKHHVSPWSCSFIYKTRKCNLTGWGWNLWAFPVVIIIFKKDLILKCYFNFAYWVFVAASVLSLLSTSRDYSLLQCSGFSLWWLLLFWSMGSVVVAHGLSCSEAHGILVPRPGIKSVCPRNQICVPCIGRRVPNYWTTREVPSSSFHLNFFFLFFIEF